MNRLFRKTLALENDEAITETEPTIVMKGPLSDVYTQALDIAYAKEDPTGASEVTPPTDPMPEVGGVVAALESQQIDVAMMQKLANAMISGDNAPTNNVQTVYGVSQNDLNEDKVVEVTQEVAGQPENAPDFILIVDGTQPGANSESASAPTERLELLSTAIESIVLANGGKVFHSFPEFIKSR